MTLNPANDSKRFLALIKETSYAVVPPQLITVTGSPTGGTLGLSHRGAAVVGGVAYNANAATVQTALEGLPHLGVGAVTVTGTNLSSGLTVTFSNTVAADPQYACVNSVFLLVADGTTLTGGTSPAVAVTGLTYIGMKIMKAEHTDHINVQVPEEERNSPDTEYEDSIVRGYQRSDWSWSGGIRTDQIGYAVALVGMTDVVTTVVASTAYKHTFKPGIGKTYTAIYSDGKALWVGRGIVGSALKLNGKGGEAGMLEMDFKGWGYLARMIDNTWGFDISYDSNSAFPRLAQTTYGYMVEIGAPGGALTATNLLAEWELDYQRDVKPLYSQQGSADPYRPQYGKRKAGFDASLIFDDATEAQNAMAGLPPTRAFALTMPGKEVLGSTKDSCKLTLPRVIYTELKDDVGQPAPQIKVKSKTLYDTALAARLKLEVVNGTSTSYTA